MPLAMYEQNTDITTRRFDRNAKDVLDELYNMAQVHSLRNWSSQSCRSSLSSRGLKLERDKTGPIRETRFCEKSNVQSDEHHHQLVILSMAPPLHCLSKLYSLPWGNEMQKSPNRRLAVYCTALIDFPDGKNRSQSKTRQPVLFELRHHILWLQVQRECCANWADLLALFPNGLPNLEIVLQEDTLKRLWGTYDGAGDKGR